MKLRLVVIAMLLLATLFAGLRVVQAQADQPATIDSGDIMARAAKLQPVEMNSDNQLAKLEPWESQVVEKMIQAAQYMNAAYWQQVDPEGQTLFASLPAEGDAQLQAEHLLVDANYGRWDRFDNFAPYLGAPQRPPGGYVFPTDLTKDELDAYIAAHPEQKDALLSPYTVVRREGDQLVTVPYHEAYAAYVMPAADLLDEAAKLSQNASLTDYLHKEAEALRTDEYFDADMSWLDVDSNLDLSVGPHEVYDDQLTGQKAFYKTNVLIVDRAASALLDKFKAAVPELQANLPVPAEFRPDQTGTLTPMEMTDDIYRTGQARAVMEGVAFSLPNDPKVWEAKGAKKVIMRNFVDTRRRVVLDPLLKVVFDDEVNSWSSDDGYFNWLLMHEVSHSLGPRTVMKDGQEITVRQALGEYYSPIEEGKADISGLYNVVYLREQGIDEAPLESHYAGYLSEALRSARFGPSSAYGVIRSAAWNFFVEQGALKLDAVSGKFTVDVNKMTQAVEDLAVKLITIEGNGDADAAAAFLKQYSYVAPDLQSLLDEANATVPVEFVPSFSVAPVLSGMPATEASATTASIESSETTTSTGRIPLADAIATMEPQAVWQNFYDLTQVPRPSHHEEQATAFLSNFGEQLGLETTVNDVGDVIIRKPGSAGLEDAPVVILQGHMDMVAQKTPDSDHDFETDPIDAYVEDGWVHAISTTLGADDGIGVAIAMAILQDDTLVHPPLEAIFTTNEEDGFTGINGLDPSDLQASTYINIDWEQEGSFCISSAGGVYLDAIANYAEEPTPDGMAAYTVQIGGLQGGHSGQDINKGRGNANELMARLLWNAPPEMGMRLSNLTGGTVYNAITTDAFAVVVVPTEQTTAFEQMVATFGQTVQKELAATEPTLVVSATAVDLPKKVMDAAVQQALLGAVYGAPQGVLRMSDSVEGLVETSDNIGIFTIDEGAYTVGDYVRSAVDSERDDTASRLTAVFDLASTEVTTHGAYSSWPANPDSPVLLLMQGVYEDLFGVAPEVTAVHAGLETSVAGVKNPELDMISVGPTLVAVHSPQERLEVASVQKVYDLITATLEKLGGE